MKHSLLGAFGFGMMAALAQEATSGISIPVTLSGQILQSPRGVIQDSSSNYVAAFRAVAYPTLKLGANWFAYGAVQIYSRPYFYEQLQPGVRSSHGVSSNVLQAYLGYSRIRGRKGVTVKAGQLSTAFGSFALRYDDARNWLIDLPVNYGYYYQPVTVTGLPGAEVDVNLEKIDARVQLTNSSPANPRKLWESDQYPVWTAGAGYAICQELRIGVSGYRGPYLDRTYPFYFPGEAAPKTQRGSAAGVDVQFARGRWNVNGEIQRFHMEYRAIPDFINTSGYAEAKFRVGPRWYVAGHASRRSRTAFIGVDESYEAAAGLTISARQQLKFGCQTLRGALTRGARDRVLAMQYVFSFDSLQAAFR